jgi:LmbE family N-acetylglucosaminyl deacetylase
VGLLDASLRNQTTRQSEGKLFPMKQRLAIVLLLALAPIATPQKSSHTLIAVVAHADDALTFAPLLAHYSRQGAKVYLVEVASEATSGRLATPGGPHGPELTRIISDETRCFCRELGIEAPIFLKFEDSKLGQVPRPPWAYVAAVKREIGRLFQQFRPDVVITTGPEGIYGHPDHRVVGAIVTELVQSGAEGAPAQLFYQGFPKDRQSAWHGEEPLSFVETRFLTVRVPYTEADSTAFKKAFACYKSQFRSEEIESYSKELEGIWRGRIDMRPWFGAVSGDDIFELKAQ